MIDLNVTICSRFETASTREWIETNGIGGYASSTVSGANTRRYHGVLIAATETPLGRKVLVAKLEETLIVANRRYDLSSNQYPGAVHPRGFEFITRFRLDPFPIWTFEVDGVQIEKSLFMIHGENSTVCRWHVVKGRSENARLEVRPLLVFRDHHHLRTEAAEFHTTYEAGGNIVSIKPEPLMPTVYLAHNATGVSPTGHWYRDFEYQIEAERGFDFLEDLYQPFALTYDLSEQASLIVSTENRSITDSEKYANVEIDRRSRLIANLSNRDDSLSQLTLAANQFIVDRGDGKTIIAGYQWFSDWGRDTMIALPGLTLATGRPEIAKAILTEFANHISQGMLPNRFPDVGDTPEYNNVDATLWFFEAIRAYVEHTDDCEFVREVLYEKLVDIVDWHIRGTRYNIHLDTDGLLYAGERGTQLTWMDAKIGDRVFTPRVGKPVEVQALWHNALRILADFSAQVGESTRYAEMADIACESFNGQFWNESEQCLVDVVDGDERDASIRPNQIFAVSLKNGLLDQKRSRAVVDRVAADLLTPFGLRSLAPSDKHYVGTYIGSPETRDSAYHQGTVWGWLLGPFVDAYRRVYPDDSAAIERFAAPIRDHLNEAMLGQVSEIFDGVEPHLPRGCAAQAWSVAEYLRILSK